MKFGLTHTFAADRELLWRNLMDVHAVAACVTGATEIEELAADHYAGTLWVKMGPVSLAFAGEVKVTLRDGEAFRGALEASARDGRAGGGFSSALMMELELVAAGTLLTLELESTVLGKIGEFGQPLIRRRIERMLADFAEKMEQRITQEGPDG